MNNLLNKLYKNNSLNYESRYTMSPTTQQFNLLHELNKIVYEHGSQLSMEVVDKKERVEIRFLGNFTDGIINFTDDIMLTLNWVHLSLC